MPRTKKKNYPSTKVKSVKLCLGCKEILNRRADYCLVCEHERNSKKSKRELLDEEYKLALLKHKLRRE